MRLGRNRVLQPLWPKSPELAPTGVSPGPETFPPQKSQPHGGWVQLRGLGPEGLRLPFP